MDKCTQESESVSSFRQPPLIPFYEFIEALIHALEAEGLRPCILRNYEGFPTQNVGGDVDFLICPSDLPRAVRAFRSVENIRIVGYAEHPHVASVFLAGTSATPDGRSLQVDFFGILGWKGLPYLPVDAVLQSAVKRSAGNLDFFVPCPVHEAIISLLTSLLISGMLKEKYFPKVQGTFSSDRLSVVAALSPQFGLKVATRLVDSVICGDRRKVLDCVGSLRVALALRSFLDRPLRAISAIARHFSMEFTALYLPRSLETVSILGPEGCGKTKLIESLVPILQSAAKVVETRTVEPRFLRGRNPGPLAENTDAIAENPRGSLLSMVSVVRWQLGEWLSQFIRTRNLLLRICEGCCYDLLVDPQRYRYGGPMGFARLVCNLFPSPDLWIMLDPATETSESRSRQLPRAEAAMRLEAYRAFVRTRKRYVILDASQTPDRVTEGAYAAIIDMLAERTVRALNKRF